MISNLINHKIITLLKVQYSNMLEYRVEIALWAISGIIPFFMLNIWTNNNLNESINISDVMLSRYFLSAFFVRQFSVVWVVFSFEEDSLMGKVSPYLIDFPANLLSGNEKNVSGGFIMQILWIILLFPVFRKIWSSGTKKFTAMGS